MQLIVQQCIVLCAIKYNQTHKYDDDFIGMAANRLDYKQSTLEIAKEEEIIQKYPTTVSTS